jgi:glycosyltransferase involved in cell wall biosynthesis
MRVLFLSPIGNIGGAERVLLSTAAGLKRERPDMVLRVISLSPGPLLDAVRDLGGEAEAVSLPVELGELGDSRLSQSRFHLVAAAARKLPRLYSFLSQLRAAITRFAPDLVHSNGIKTHLLSRFTVRSGVPVVWHIHDFLGTRRVAGTLLRRARSRVRIAIAVSSAVAIDARAALPGVRVEMLPNAVDLVRFSPGVSDGTHLDSLASFPLAPPGTVRVGLVATYARWKGHLTFLEAAARLAADQPTLPIRWYIVGGAIYHTAAQFTEAELRAEVVARGIADRVAFVPFTSNPVPVYRGLDVVVHASTQPEPFGLTIVEAMACGRPVVVSAAGGASELFRDGRDAVGFSPGQSRELAEAVRRLVENPTLRDQLGVAARRAAEDRFDAAGYPQKLLDVYRHAFRC